MGYASLIPHNYGHILFIVPGGVCRLKSALRLAKRRLQSDALSLYLIDDHNCAVSVRALQTGNDPSTGPSVIPFGPLGNCCPWQPVLLGMPTAIRCEPLSSFYPQFPMPLLGHHRGMKTPWLSQVAQASRLWGSPIIMAEFEEAVKNLGSFCGDLERPDHPSLFLGKT